MFYIYRTTNLINGKTYIGQHEFSLGKKDIYMGKGVLIKKAIKKYGVKNFKKDIIEVALSHFETNVLEKYYIAKERAIGKAEYNIADGGQGGNLGEEVNKKIAEALKGRPKSEEHKKKIAKTLEGNIPWNKGVPMSEEQKIKLSEKNKGSHHTEETKKRIGDTLKGHPGYWKGKTAHNKGKPMPDKQRLKMDEVREAYKKSGRKDWNAFQKEYKEKTLS